VSTRGAAAALRVLWRRLYFGVRFLGRRIDVHPSSYVSRRSVLRTRGGGSIRIGRHCEVHDFAMILTYGGDIAIGDYSSVNPFSIVYGHGGTRIGSGVRIAAHTVIIPANHVPSTAGTRLFRTGVTAAGIRIGDDVWIGSGVRILDGVTIGDRCIIGAGSVVTRSIPAGSTAVGVPARVVQEKAGVGHES
jgi:acetyltransferase-like isoleucine patch superfamily enzyme